MKKVSANHISATVIKGINDVASALNGLSWKGIDEKTGEKILKMVAAPLIDEMKARAPIKEGKLRESITVWSGKRRPYRVYVGPNYRWWGLRKGGRGVRFGKGGSIAHIIEYGTVNRVMQKGLRAGGITDVTMQKFKGPPQFAPYKGKSTGVVAARPFIRPALAATKKEIEYNLQTKVVENIITVATKLNLSIK